MDSKHQAVITPLIDGELTRDRTEIGTRFMGGMCTASLILENVAISATASGAPRA